MHDDEKRYCRESTVAKDSVDIMIIINFVEINKLR